jgi:glucan 1,3-beta-glucosidase
LVFFIFSADVEMLIDVQPCQGYNKEGCASDKGWCFKDTVGKDLPSTFFSYPGQKIGSAVPSPAVLTAVLNMHVPSQSDILNLAAQDSVLEAFAPETVDPVNTEAVSDTPSLSLNATASLLQDLISLTARSATHSQRGHRFVTIHSRRQVSFPFGTAESSVLSASQQAVIKGYSDGFLTAKIFAAHELSKLGFKGQYIEDSLRSLTGVIGMGEQDVYRRWFGSGLADGQTLVRSYALVT